jgi:hypothetical protein
MFISVYARPEAMQKFAENPHSFATLINEQFGERWGYNLNKKWYLGGGKQENDIGLRLRIEIA